MNPAGIRLGTSVGLFVRKLKRDIAPVVRYRELWGTKKREELLESLSVSDFNALYQLANPEVFNLHSFRPRQVTGDYRSWPTLEDIAALFPENGLMEKRGGGLIDFDAESLEQRMKLYFDSTVTWEAFRDSGNPLAEEASGYKPEAARKRLIHDEGFRPKQLVRYFTRPFDFRYCYYSGVNPLWNRPRPDLWKLNAIPGNGFLVSRKAAAASREGVPFVFVRSLGDNDAIKGHAYYFPLRVLHDEGKLLGATAIDNLSANAVTYLKAVGYGSGETKIAPHTALWMHALSIGFSPEYLNEHAEGIAIGWPRIPMPSKIADLERSALLGREIADLLDPAASVSSVTSGTIYHHMKVLGVLSSTNLTINAGWGHKDKNGHVNPGQGHVQERLYTTTELEALSKGAAQIGITIERAIELLGSPLDIFLNEEAYWKCVPRSVWEYVIGGYQVIKKWLSYREASILARPLSKDEAREVTSMVRRITALVLMTDALDRNYAASRDDHFSWPTIIEKQGPVS